MHLRHAFAAARLAVQIEAQLGKLRVLEPSLSIFRRRTGKDLRVAASFDPLLAKRRQTAADVDLRRRVGIEARGVVNHDRRVVAGLGDLTHRHAQLADIDLARIGQRLDGGLVDVRGRSKKFGIGVHGASFGGITRIRFKGFVSPAREATLPCAGPLRGSKGITSVR